VPQLLKQSFPSHLAIGISDSVALSQTPTEHGNGPVCRTVRPFTSKKVQTYTAF